MWLTVLEAQATVGWLQVKTAWLKVSLKRSGSSHVVEKPKEASGKEEGRYTLPGHAPSLTRLHTTFS